MRSMGSYLTLGSALTRYRVMAYTVGTGLLILVFVGIPLQVWGHSKSVVEVVGPIHGYLYLVYLAAAFDLTRRARFGIGRLFVMISAGLVPFVAFIIEHRIVNSLRDEGLIDGPGGPGLPEPTGAAR